MQTTLGRNLLLFAERWPQTFAMGISAPCVVAGDVLAQQMELKFDGKDLGQVDTRRVGSVFCWAVGYLGFAQYNIYLRLVDPVFTIQRFGTRLSPLLKSVACNAIVTPFINVPLYYLWSTTRLPPAEWDLSESIGALKREWAMSSASGIALWGPAQYFNFAYVSVPMRIPFMSSVAFVWSLIISLQAQFGNVRPVKMGAH